jgi:hypothetical protein
MHTLREFEDVQPFTGRGDSVGAEMIGTRLRSGTIWRLTSGCSPRGLGHGLQDLNCKPNSRVSATNLRWLVKALNTHASKLGIVGMRSVAGRLL